MNALLSFVLASCVILFKPLGVSAKAGTDGGESNGFQLSLDTRSDTSNSGYVKTSLDGLDSHLLYTLGGSDISKVVDGSTELWSKQGDESCLGLLLTEEGGQNKLLMLVLMKKPSLNSNPLDTKFFKSEGGQWNETDRDGYFGKLREISPDQQDPGYSEIDINSSKGVQLVGEDQSKIGYQINLFLPGYSGRIGKINGSSTIFDRASENSYLLYFVLAKRGDSRQFGFGMARTSNGYEEKFYTFNGSQWKCTDMSGLKKYVMKDLAASKLRGAKKVRA